MSKSENIKLKGRELTTRLTGILRTIGTSTLILPAQVLTPGLTVL
jgi:hypothetical protein